MSLPGDKIRISEAGSEREKQLQDTVLMVAGADPSNPTKALLLPISAKGLVCDIQGGEQVPAHDSITLEYYGSTNNLHYVKYRVGGTSGTVVATNTLTYAGGGAANNDKLVGSVFS